MPLVLQADIDAYKSKQLSDYADSLPFTPPSSYTPPTPSAPTPSDSLTNPLGSQDSGGASPVSPTADASPVPTLPAPSDPVTAPLAQPQSSPAPSPTVNSSGPTNFDQALEWGKQQLGKAYIWGSAGGRSDLSGNAPGFDCSGFVSQFYNKMGLSIPAQTASAYNATKPISQDEAKPGDIVEFNMGQNDPHVQHIAVYLGNGQILQSGGTSRDVNIGRVDQFGPGTFEFRRADGFRSDDKNQDAAAHVGGSGTIAGMITSAAQRFGIDPSTALRVATSEGGTSEGAKAGDSGSSFGPFQLHYGNVASGGNAVAGLGDEFTRITGLDARDPKNAQAAIDFALQNVAQNGWGAFHGAVRTGIGQWDGIGVASSQNLSDSAPGVTTTPSSPTPTFNVLDYAQSKLGDVGNALGGAASSLGSAAHDAGNAVMDYAKSLPNPFDSASTTPPAEGGGYGGPSGPLASPGDALQTGANALGNAVEQNQANPPLAGIGDAIANSGANQFRHDNFPNALEPNHPSDPEHPPTDALAFAGAGDVEMKGADVLKGLIDMARSRGLDTSALEAQLPKADPIHDAIAQAKAAGIDTSSLETQLAPASPTVAQPTIPQMGFASRDEKLAARAARDQAIEAARKGYGVKPDEVSPAGAVPAEPTAEEAAQVQRDLDRQTMRGQDTVGDSDWVNPRAAAGDTSATATRTPIDDTPPAMTFDAEGNQLSGETPPPEPPKPPTTDSAAATPEPTPTTPDGPRAFQTQPKNLLQRVGAAINDAFAPVKNAPQAVQDAVENYVGAKNLAIVQMQRQVDAGVLSQTEASQAIGKAKAQAQTQFLNDVSNSLEGVERKDILDEHGILSKNPTGKPAGWVDGESLGLHGVYVSPEVATVVRNTLRQGESTTFLTGLAKAQGQVKQVALNSPFHAFQEAFQAVRLGGGQLDVGGTADMLGASTVNAADLSGKRFAAYMQNPQTQRAADRLVKAGGTLQQGEATDFFSTANAKGMAIRGAIGGGAYGGETYAQDKAQGKSDQDALTDALINAGKGAVAAGPLGHVIGKSIFERQIPTLKIEGFRMLVNNGYADKTAAAMVNQTFGGNNLAMVARSPVVQDMMRSVLLAPDWWEGFARNFLSAGTELRSSTGMGDLARRQVAATAVSAAVTLEGLNLLTTGHFTNQNEPGHELDLELPHSMTSGIPGSSPGVEGQMDHIDILGPIKPMAQALSTMPGMSNRGDVGQFARNRLGTIVGGGLDLAQNRNPADGKPIVAPGSDPLDTAGSVGKYAVDRVMPIGVTGAEKGNDVAGPLGGAAQYVTGMRLSSETPDQENTRGYYAGLDKAKADMHNWLHQQPEYQQATPAAQRSMQYNKDIELEKYLREQNNVAPQDKGMPAKYLGVSDKRMEARIDDAKARVDAYKADPIHSPRPSADDYVLAAHTRDPRYTQASKARSVGNKTLDSRFAQAFTAP